MLTSTPRFARHLNGWHTALALLAASAAPFAAADAPSWLGAPDCHIAILNVQPADGKVHWNGLCLDGYASGMGLLSWETGQGIATIASRLVRGEVNGLAVLTTPQYVYTGTLRAGVPHGKGEFKFVPSKDSYEGEVSAGKPHGEGDSLQPDYTFYSGEWVEGKRSGLGQASFGTGGSYKGEWKDDRFHGQGTIVYAGAEHSYTGLFENGYPVGKRPGTPVDEKLTGNAVLPPQSDWKALTEAQKAQIRRNYPALEVGDEPPYPLKGEQLLQEAVRQTDKRSRPNAGAMLLYVQVGKDGKPLQASAYGSTSLELEQTLSTAAMLQHYKPALCRGEPCEMIYAFRVDFGVDR